MKNIVLQIRVNPKLYNKNPLDSTLGKKIISSGLDLIDEIGFEKFNFKKLGERIQSTEASIYRYFTNKHQLFLYLLNWYWEWLHARVELNTIHLASPEEKLKIIIGIVADNSKRFADVEHIDEEALHRIVVREGTKGYHHKMVDSENKEGFFLAYKRLCEKIAAVILDINPSFPYPRALASSIIETANNNLYFSQHLPRLTDLRDNEEDISRQVEEMLEFFCFRILKK